MKSIYDSDDEAARGEAVVVAATKLVDWKKYAELVQQSADRDTMKLGKYMAAPERTLRLAVPHLIRLDLDRRPPCRLLDISTGAGFLVLAARALGHDAYATDAIGPGPEVVDPRQDLRFACCAMLGLYAPGHFQVLHYPPADSDVGLYLCTPMPDFGVHFDVITAMAVSPMSRWPSGEWRKFLIDCAKNAPAGKLYVKTNVRAHPCPELGRDALLGLEMHEQVFGDGSILVDLRKVAPGAATIVEDAEKPAKRKRPLTRYDAIDAMCAKGSYLESHGWFNSYVSRLSTDAAGNPVPWIPYPAVHFLEERLKPEMKVYEFGAGGSTLWYAKRVKSVTSVEHNPKWAKRLAANLPPNAKLTHLPLGPYAEDILQYTKEFDIICVDGRERVNCVRNLFGALKDDGVVIWDNVRRERYAEGWALLAERGFRRIDFYGPAPVSAGQGCVAIFYRPGNVLGI